MEELCTYLPEEILTEFFLRLPVKTLVRFRCVCKSWNRIISSTCFVNAQRNTISNTDNTFLLCTHRGLYALVCKEELTNHSNYHYTSEIFKIKNYFGTLKIYGSCKGLLCVSHAYLYIESHIYLLNPIIRNRKVKKIPKIPNIKFDEFRGRAYMCFGYFDDDYKLIKIAPFCDNYCVGVYSLSTDCWKITYCGSNYTTFKCVWHTSSKWVNGVAYFVIYENRIVCFDLHNERIREVEFPENFNEPEEIHHFDYRMFSMEEYEESIALIKTSYRHLVMWVLRNCGVTNTFTWEKKVTIELPNINIYPIGFTNKGTYLLRGLYLFGEYYLCDFDTLELTDFTFDFETYVFSTTIFTRNEEDLLEIDYLVENLVLLDEQTLDPFVATEPCSTHTLFCLMKET